VKKMLAVLTAAAFGVASIGVFAASHTGGAPMKDAKVDCKDPKNKNDKACAPKKDETKKK
jgi:hypothetical protein